ncbi:MAG: bifunctional phosphoribosylaminoimidazolecarboxamide formyltransferase/IMP cyclohydrolase [Proteobacteria bacterium]|nr:bifunctional phosphoribosylaminoimidazolecarboxamide formyltransferase/IMP cyclohydrolase [Pseudomonadota bacterium]
MKMSLQKIKRALISVSDKSGIIELAQFLAKNDVELISTGGTCKLLLDNGLKVKDISEFTGFPEIMDGRVKTLHPKVHGALLAVLDNESHQKQAAENDISSIDLVIINLYPFVNTVKKGAKYDEVIENIDIGGPSMIRSAAKNHQYKTVITSSDDYPSLITEMQSNDGATTLEYRKNSARKAFTNTANYDQAIASYFTNNQEQVFADKLALPATLKQNLRYGENSHQKAALYANDFAENGIVGAKQIQGKELSYNNLNDADAAFNIACEFEEPAVAIVKHANPCGVALCNNINSAYKKALEADSKSAFGGIVALNKEIKEDTAQEISKMFYEVIIAPSFSDEALEILKKKKNLRLLEAKFEKENKPQIKSISGGFLMQEQDNKKLSIEDIEQAGKVKIDQSKTKELLFAMTVCKHVKSNAIVVTNNLQTVGIGAGQMNRVDSVEIACKKAKNFTDIDSNIIDKSQGAVLASDAFFPFPDNVEIASKYNISALIAPKGSIRDQEVINKADEFNIGLSFINSRHFKH